MRQVILLTLFAGTLMWQSCKQGTCDEAGILYFQLNQLRVLPGFLDSNEQNYFYSHSVAEEQYGKSLAFQLIAEGKYISQQSEYRGFDFFSKAYAKDSDCEADSVVQTNRLTALRVRSMVDFSDTVPAFSDVTSYFRVISRNPFQLDSIPEVLTDDRHLIVILPYRQELQASQQFEFEATFSDSTKAVISSGVFKVK